MYHADSIIDPYNLQKNCVISTFDVFKGAATKNGKP